jgi:hypothetical protein
VARLRDIDGPRLLELATAAGLGEISALARAFATQRDGRAPTPGQLNNARRQVQKWLDGPGGIGWRNAGHLAAVLNLDSPEPFLVPDEPTPIEDLSTRALMALVIRRLEGFEATVDEAAQGVAEALARMASEIEALSARIPAEEQRDRQAATNK